LDGLGGILPFPLPRVDIPRAGFSSGASPASGVSRDPEDVGREFETLFLTYLVRELKLGRTPGLDGDGGDGGSGVPGASVYEGFITGALAESLAKSGAFGIGKAVAEYVRHHSAGAAATEKKPLATAETEKK
jgi:F0F1-type ATP synthase membrane subunit c/vacuolar-type H+-ATPase subunit K